MKPRTFSTLFLTTFLSGTVCLVPHNACAKGGGSYGGGSHGGAVHVSGYTRSNGTYVQPYTRSAPHHGSSYSGSSTYSGSSSDSKSSSGSDTSNSTAFQDALDTADSATTIAQSAVSTDDWKLVVSKWQSAIALLTEMPASNPHFAEAQAKISEYLGKLADARKHLNQPSSTQSQEVATQETSNDGLQHNEVSSVDNSAQTIPDTSTELASSLTNSQDAATPTPSPITSKTTAITAPVSQPPQVTPTSDTDNSNHAGRTLILTVLAVIVAAGVYKAKRQPKTN